MDSSVGIRGVALYLPPIVRRNDWWPSEVVARWKTDAEARRSAPLAHPRSLGTARVLAALVEQAADPFQGGVERHVMPDEVTVFDLAEQAARLAITRAGVAADEIDVLLTHTVIPDALGNDACQLHHRLGLPRRCFAMETCAAGHSFQMQLTLAEAMITSGRARLALLVQACGASRSVAIEDPLSPLFGDGATAVVVGRVSGRRGIRGSSHHADGRYPNTMMARYPSAVSSERDPGMIYVADAARMRDVFLQTADVCKESIETVLASTHHTASDIGFFAMYQGTPWLRRVVQDYVGFQHARSIDTFTRTGYLFAATLPAGLALAEQAGLLRPDDLVMVTGGGTGMTFGSILVRWGS